jgi:hypothetical protein
MSLGEEAADDDLERVNALTGACLRATLHPAEGLGLAERTWTSTLEDDVASRESLRSRRRRSRFAFSIQWNETRTVLCKCSADRFSSDCVKGDTSATRFVTKSSSDEPLYRFRVAVGFVGVRASAMSRPGAAPKRPACMPLFDKLRWMGN